LRHIQVSGEKFLQSRSQNMEIAVEKLLRSRSNKLNLFFKMQT